MKNEIDMLANVLDVIENRVMPTEKGEASHDENEC